MDYKSRPLAFTDVETTGIDPQVHEIIDLGLVLADQRSLEILETMHCRIKPQNIDRAMPDSLKVNGYNEKDWVDAGDLKSAMEKYSKLTEGAIFAAHNVTFDWGFIFAAFKKTGVIDRMDYHRRELATLSGEILRNSKLEKENLSRVADFLGLGAEPDPHTALNGALFAHKVYKRLREIIDGSLSEEELAKYL